MCDSSNSKYFCVFCNKDDSKEGDSCSGIKPSSSTPSKSSPPSNTYTRPSNEVIRKVMSHFEASHTYHPINYIRERSLTLGLSSREFKYNERFNKRLANIESATAKDTNPTFKTPLPRKAIKTARQVVNIPKQEDLVSSSPQVQLKLQENASFDQTEEDGSKVSGDVNVEAKDKAEANSSVSEA